MHDENVTSCNDKKGEKKITRYGNIVNALSTPYIWLRLGNLCEFTMHLRICSGVRTGIPEIQRQYRHAYAYQLENVAIAQT